MIRVIIHGCNGRMGQVVASLILEEKDMELVAGVDVSDHISNPFPVFSGIEACTAEADVVIDFASAKAVDGLLDYCAKKKLPCVLCTTGLSAKQEESMRQAAEKTAILKSANMSLGVNILLKLVRDAAAVLADAGFDIEIVEKHHNQKLDAPSGTALALADAVNEQLNHEYGYIYDRSTRRQKRAEKEIGISAIRGGTIVGDHDVIFAGMDEVVTLSHSANSRAVFGKGAVQAAKFLAGKAPGLYRMNDVIEAASGV